MQQMHINDATHLHIIDPTTKGVVKIFMKSGDYAAVNFLYISTILMLFIFFLLHTHRCTHKIPATHSYTTLRD